MLAVCIEILLGIPLLDLGIKYYVETHYDKETEIPKWKGRIFLRYVQNEGMACNILEKKPMLVRWASLLAMIPLAGYALFIFAKRRRGVEKLSLSLILGGAISNLYDRFVRKYVVDYLGFKTKWKKWTNLTYNLGDLAIFAGGFGLVFHAFFGKK